MISYIKGLVVSIEEQAIVIEMNGIGWQCFVPQPTLFCKKEITTIATYIHWNQEHGPTLYGFTTHAERAVFELVMSCSGIGPKVGLALLAQLSADQVVQALQNGNDLLLSSCVGIGPKKAEQMVVQLRCKADKIIKGGSGVAFVETKTMQRWTDLCAVLKSLNYSRGEIDRVLVYLKKEEQGADVSFDSLIRRALSFFAQKR